MPSHYDDLQTQDLAVVVLFQRGTVVSEELDELIEMARTIRMTPEQGIMSEARYGNCGAALPTATSRLRTIPSLGR